MTKGQNEGRGQLESFPYLQGVSIKTLFLFFYLDKYKKGRKGILVGYFKFLIVYPALFFSFLGLRSQKAVGLSAALGATFIIF